MSRDRSIVERLVSGEELDLTRIDDAIDDWHEADTSLSLREWLGLSADEYQLYVEKPAAIRVILAARRHHQSLKDLLSAEDAASLVGVCGATPAEVTELRKWLQDTGRL